MSDTALPNANQQRVSAAAPSVAFADYVTLPSAVAPAQATFSSPLGGSATLFSGWGEVSATHVPSTGTTIQSPLHSTVLLAAATPLVR